MKTCIGLATMGLALAVASLAGMVAGGESARWTETTLRERYPDPDAAAPAKDFIGPSECEDCHDERMKSLGTSFHAALLSPKESGSRGCESCHGPGRAHSDDGGEGPIRHPRKAAAREIDGVCLRCHLAVLATPVRGHRDWVEGAGGEIRACVQCHSVHVDRSAKAFDESVGPFATIAALEAVATYVEPARCIKCHPAFHPQMGRSGHRALRAEGKACGTCHGPGSLHAESGGDPLKIVLPTKQPPENANGGCLGCHAAGNAVARWTCAEHAKEGNSCVSCHDPNGPEGGTLRAPEFTLCGSCHLDVKARFLLPNRHRVAEGRVTCTDCHDPHGNTGKIRDKDLRYRACLECHGEKGGPFLNDHDIKRTEGCTACHDPHGSPNRRLLAYAEIRPLCLSCHPNSFHNLADPQYRNCLSCHTEIHGSDLDRHFLR